MNRIYLTIIVLIQSITLFSQGLSEIEKKYDFVEVWGLENQTKKDFLTEITSFPEGICQQSLVKMGIKDGDKLPIPYSNKIIITVRDIPNYTSESNIRPFENRKLKKWKEFKSTFEKLEFYERQQVPFFITLSIENNNSGIDSLFNKLHSEFKSYGIDLKKEKIMQSLDVYKKYSNQFSKEDVLSALYHSENKDSIRQAAIFIAPYYLKNDSDLFDFLPLLLVKGSGVQPLLSSFIKDYKGKFEWNSKMDLLTKLVNNPNPFQSLLALRIADKTGFTKSNMRILLSSEMKTIKDILESKYLPQEYINYLIIFLNKYSEVPIEQDKKMLIKRLK